MYDYFRNCSSNAYQSVVKLVGRKVYMTVVAIPMNLSFIQGHKYVSNLTTF